MIETFVRGGALFGLALVVAACSSHPPLMEASGPIRALNVARWQPTSDDLRGERLPLAPIDSWSLNQSHSVFESPSKGTQGEPVGTRVCPSASFAAKTPAPAAASSDVAACPPGKSP